MAKCKSPSMLNNIGNRWNKEDISSKNTTFKRITVHRSNQDLMTRGQVVTTACESATDDYVDSQISALKKVKRAKDLVFLNSKKGQMRRKTVAS